MTPSDLAGHDVEADIAQRPDVAVVPAITIASSASASERNTRAGLFSVFVRLSRKLP